jgi:hypothetical protein
MTSTWTSGTTTVRARVRLRGSNASFDQQTDANELQSRAFQLLELNPNRP